MCSRLKFVNCNFNVKQRTKAINKKKKHGPGGFVGCFSKVQDFTQCFLLMYCLIFPVVREIFIFSLQSRFFV